MNALFFTQSHSLELFYQLALSMQANDEVKNVGFYVTDKIHFERFVKEYPDIERCPIVKEWEIVERAAKAKVDQSKLNEYENRYGDPTLWGATIADRRLCLGRKAPYTQDYVTRLSHERISSHLQVAFDAVLTLFDRVRPDFVVNFICVTSGEYIGHLVARERRIPFLNLRPTRIKNYFYAADSIYEPPSKFVRTYKGEISDANYVTKYRDEAGAFVRSFLEKETLYEGVFTHKGKDRYFPNIVKGLRSLLGFGKLFWYEWHYRLGKYRYDNHIKGFLGPFVHARFVKPWRLCVEKLFYGRRYCSEADLKKTQYVFYPLHKEPEATLLVYNKYLLNQIEVIRNIAQSIPIGMKLMVKEHPVSLGYRKSSFYKAIRAIPNVVLVCPEVKGRTVIENAELVAVLGGTVGFEALLLKKPVVVLGNVLFEMIDSQMMRKVRSLNDLAKDIDDLLCHYVYSEEALVNYVQFIMDNGVAVDFYSSLLKRNEAYRIDQDSSYSENIQTLKNYVLKKVLHDTHTTV